MTNNQPKNAGPALASPLTFQRNLHQILDF